MPVQGHSRSLKSDKQQNESLIAYKFQLDNVAIQNATRFVRYS